MESNLRIENVCNDCLRIGGCDLALAHFFSNDIADLGNQKIWRMDWYRFCVNNSPSVIHQCLFNEPLNDHAGIGDERSHRSLSSRIKSALSVVCGPQCLRM